MYNVSSGGKAVSELRGRIFFPLTVCALAALIGACSPGPKSYSIRGDGDQILNRDSNGKSLSVVVRIYQLKDAREFSKLTFDTLASGRAESDLLGPALLEKSDVILVPGGVYTSSEKLLEDTQFVGIVAFFRRPDEHHWRQLAEAGAVRSQGLAFRVQDCYVVLTGINAVPLPDQAPNVRPTCATANGSAARQGSLPASYGNQQAAPPPAPRSDSGQKRNWVPQGMPEVNVNAATPVAPINTRIGSGGINAINVGTPAAVPPPAYYGPPAAAPAPGYYGSPR